MWLGFLLLITCMIIAGLFGGWVTYQRTLDSLKSDPDERPPEQQAAVDGAVIPPHLDSDKVAKTKRRDLLRRSLVLGVGASLVVPLFLKLTAVGTPDIVDEILKADWSILFESHLERDGTLSSKEASIVYDSSTALGGIQSGAEGPFQPQIAQLEAGSPDTIIEEEPDQELEEESDDREENLDSAGSGGSITGPIVAPKVDAVDVADERAKLAKAQGYLLVFFGFCLIASISSRAFIDSISERVLKQASQAKEAASEAQKAAEEAERKAEDALAEEETADAASQRRAEVSDIDISPDEKKILDAIRFSNFRRRTESGLSNETEIARSQLVPLLRGLRDRSLLDEVPARKDGSPRWRISSAGWAYLRKASS